MTPRRMIHALTVAAMVAACVEAGPSTTSTGSPVASPVARGTAVASPVATSVVAEATGTPVATSSPPQGGTSTPTPTESLTEDFESAEFGDSATITNPWLPLTPGRRWVHEGVATVDGVKIDRRVVLTVTDLEKTIAGVRAIVGFEIDYDQGDLVESELVFWAEDVGGTVWHLGQYPEVYENGTVSETPIWIHGLEDARAGIVMKADPDRFGPSYSQGWGPAVDWTDRAKVFETGSVTCVPVDCYEDVLVLDEFNRDEPDAHQLKYYARGAGNVRVGWAGAREEEQEVLELVESRVLGPEELAQVRAEVLAQDARGYEYSPDLYGQTPAAG